MWSATSAMQPHPEGYYSLGYWDDPDRTRALYRGPWMTCGDLARRDSDGYFWFEGRADDVIKSAGYRIGPFEVESALLLHPAVAEAAVVGVPDALRGHIVKAYVVLKAERAPYPGLEDELVDVVKTHVGRHQYPRAIELARRAAQDGDGQDPALPAPAAAMTDLGAAAKLRAVFELSPTILAVTGLDDGRVREVNDAFLRTTGYTREEIIGRPHPRASGSGSIPRCASGPRRPPRGAARAATWRRASARRAARRSWPSPTPTSSTSTGGPASSPRSPTSPTASRAEAALRESERRFARPSTPTRCRCRSRACATTATSRSTRPRVRHSGYTREEMLGRTKAELGLWVAPSSAT